MNILRPIIALFVGLLTLTPCFGQQKLFDIVWKDLRAIQKTTKNPVIIIGPEKTYAITTVKLKSDSNAIVWESYYLLFQKGKQNYITRYIETVAARQRQKLYKSKPIEFVNDTVISSLIKYKSEIFSEEVLPFIYADTVWAVSVFKEGFLMHTFPFGLSIHYDSDNFRHFEFDEIAMRQTLMPGIIELPKNLNFEYNRRTKIYHIYLLLDKMLTDYAEKFEFE